MTLDLFTETRVTSSAEWVAAQHEAIDRRATQLHQAHGDLVVPLNPHVDIRFVHGRGLLISVGTVTRTGRRQHRVITGRQLTAVFGRHGLEVFDTTRYDQLHDEIALGKVGLRRRATAQQVIDALAATVGPQHEHTQ